MEIVESMQRLMEGSLDTFKLNGWEEMAIHYNRGAELLDYVINKVDVRVESGRTQALTKPWLGVEVNEERVNASQHPPDWHNPERRHAGGGLAE